MSGQLWGECPYCARRKRLTKGDLLYGHKNRGGYDCFGGGVGPVDGSVRTADKVSLTKVDVVDEYTDPAIVTAEYPSAWGWDALYAFLWLGALAAGFAAGWWWRGR